MLEGIIDCYHGDEVDLAAFKASGGLGVFLKASQGKSFIDPEFVRRLCLARNLGLLTGAYHFCTAASAADQVKLFLSLAGGLAGGIPGLRLAIDIEPHKEDTVTIPQAADIATRIRMATGTLPIVYAGRYGPDGKGTGWPNKVLSLCDLWIYHYTDAATPNLPKGWSTYRLWQYTDKPMDLNRFNGDEAALRAWWV